MRGFAASSLQSPSPGRVETRVLQLNRSLDFEASNLMTLRLKKNSRSDRLSTVTAISNKIPGLLSDDRNLLGVKDKVSNMGNTFERFREVITTMSSKPSMPSLRAKRISRDRRESFLFSVSRSSNGLHGLTLIC